MHSNRQGITMGEIKQKPFRQIQPSSGIIQVHLAPCVTPFIQNPVIFKTRAYSEPEVYSEPEACWEPCQTSSMEGFTKISNSCSCFCKITIILQYQLFTFFTFLMRVYSFTPEEFIQCKKVKWPKGMGVVNFDITMLCCNFLFVIA